MATALHSRNIQTTDLEDQYDSAGKQLHASRTAASLELSERRELHGECLDLTFHGEAHRIAQFVQSLDVYGIYITQVAAEDDTERDLLQGRIGDLTYVSEEHG